MNILFLLRGEVSDLPPVISLINTVAKHHCTMMLCNSCSKYAAESLDPSVRVKTFSISNLKFLRTISFRTSAWRRVEESGFKYDLIWVLSAETAIALGRKLLKKKYFISSYELYDKLPFTKFRLKKYVIGAEKVFVPEFNRASIIRSWWALKELPVIVPNSPNIAIDKILAYESDKEVRSAVEKICSIKNVGNVVLYQGVIDETRRNLDLIVKAIDEINGCYFVIMGRDSYGYVKKLKLISEKVVHIDHIPAPAHLLVTRCADIGILSYTFGSLNSLYCAPNKLYEYASFGIPMIGNNIPGLRYEFLLNGIGEIYDEDSLESIKVSILKLLRDFENYRARSFQFYEKIDIEAVVVSALNEDHV